MRLIGFNFTKISAEKLSDVSQNLKINTGIDLEDIKEAKSSFFKAKEDMVAVSFKYSINYEPNYAKLNFSGNVLMGVEHKKAKEIFKMWEEEKVPEDFRLIIFNIILKKSSLKALQLGEEMNLPPHFPLPSIKFSKDQNKELDSEENDSEEKKD